MLLPVVAAFYLLLIWVLWKHGALTLAIAACLEYFESVPWTLDMSRWYAIQGVFTAAIVVALAFWGFRNVLGKQTAFPSEALDG